MKRLLVLVLSCAALSGCVSEQGRFQPLDAPQASKAPDCNVEVFENQAPDRPFVKVARLDAHMEITHFLPLAKEHLLPELKRQACLSGSDAIVDIKEIRSGYLEMNSYHLTATGIAFR